MTKRTAAFEFLNTLAKLSHCKRLHTAAIIVPDDFSRIDAIGYNGPARGFPNDGCTAMKGKCGCVHAEANALLKVRSWETNLTMMCLTSPCPVCARLIINSGIIRRVVCDSAYRLSEGKDILLAAGIEYDLF